MDNDISYYPDSAVFDGSHALMSKDDLDRLPEFSDYIPKSVAPGKTWKVKVKSDYGGTRYIIGRFDLAPDEAGVLCKCEAVFRELLLV